MVLGSTRPARGRPARDALSSSRKAIEGERDLPAVRARAKTGQAIPDARRPGLSTGPTDTEVRESGVENNENETAAGYPSGDPSGNDVIAGSTRLARLSEQDTALSRWKAGFNPPRVSAGGQVVGLQVEKRNESPLQPEA